MEGSRRHTWRWIGAAIGLLLLVLIVNFVADFARGRALIIGPETTFVTGPVRPDGSIDYPAALHQRMSEGVNPDDNAAILIDRAIGIDLISAPLRPQYYEWMKTEPVAEGNGMGVTQPQFIIQKSNASKNDPELHERIEKEFSKTLLPWTREECPMAAEWLDANEKAMPLIELATTRKHYYSPKVTSGTLMESETTLQNVRQAARLLSARAMLRLGSNDIDGAWSDLLSCHRLSRLVGQRPSDLIQLLVATAIDAVASKGDTALIAHRLSVEKAREFQTEHGKLPPLAAISDVIDFAERLNSLDAIFMQFSSLGFDTNLMLRRTNQLYDQMATALKPRQRHERMEAVTTVETELSQRKTDSSKPLRMIPRLMIAPRKAITESVGDTLLLMLVPATTQADSARTRMDVRCAQVQIGFALAAYHAKHGSYPEALDSLLGEFIEAVPMDAYTSQPFVYKPREDGFLIYSVGPNGKDDAGQSRGGANLDDVSFEVPPRLED